MELKDTDDLDSMNDTYENQNERNVKQSNLEKVKPEQCASEILHLGKTAVTFQGNTSHESYHNRPQEQNDRDITMGDAKTVEGRSEQNTVIVLLVYEQFDVRTQ